MRLLVTHHSPDLDAIGSVWMLKTFDAQHFADAKVAFVDPGKTISTVQLSELGFTDKDFEEIVHTDTGLGEFDHHQAERGKLHICATSLTYDHCCQIHPELIQDKALQSLVEFVNDIDHFGDCFWPDANSHRYAFMLHEILEGLQRSGLHTDETQLDFGMKCLGGVYKKLEEMVKAEEVITRGIVFDTKWGKAIGIETNNDTVIKFAQKAGYALVIKKDPDEFHVRIKAVPKREIDLTALADAILAEDQTGTWYLHPAKTMLLNGSDKWTDKVATPLSLHRLIDLAKQTLS